ncbi:uncharacterized protein LOC123267404 isoform X1 [Cotesia glomerata]|uniref:SEFIR domain-containing protein n=1 Tax=Cotesia glomerata TaxID=32391 RepID=A0AAV7HWV8_COTGL|nr:uncharacterized protein LOC123267404 isoform X1 [Cotesia glomerata]KAH0535242.1 hypothetical protein KQX54_015386 [Cotesia glomerata]
MMWLNVSCILLSILRIKAISTNCNYEYNYSCDNNGQKDTIIPRPISHIVQKGCSLDNIRDNANYTLILSENGLLPTGIIKVNITLPSANCIYKVALLVNSTIKNNTDCHKHEFTNILHSELHSVDQTICLSNSNIEQNHDSLHQNNGFLNKCQDNNIALYFEHVYAGCYALRFTIDDKLYAIRSKKYITTTYQRSEVKEPLSHCYYDDGIANNNDNESRNLVTFRFGVSIFSGSSSLVLQLIPLSIEDESKGEACVKYGKIPLEPWEISLYGSSLSTNNCSIAMVQDSNENLTEDIECIFILPVLYNQSYCFLLILNDDRCVKQTVWKPPPVQDEISSPCTWIAPCMRVTKSQQAIEYNGELSGNKTVMSDINLLLPIAAGIIISILVISGAIVCICRQRLHSSRQNQYLNATLSDLKSTNCEIDSVDTDDANEKLKKQENDCKAIVIFYARESENFIKFMVYFREIIEYFCNCHVYDWYAPNEWNSVAKVGAFDWANNLFKNNYRVIWIDTPATRSLINIKNSVNNFHDDRLNIDSISDFRDLAFAPILDCVKRNIELQYTKHFIVRLEGYCYENSREDPFADLSPHARFIIPHHLKQLFSHLAFKRSEMSEEELNREEILLRERLAKINSDS